MSKPARRNFTPAEILALPMNPSENDAHAASVAGYLRALLSTLWKEKEGFSGKRPFGNSGWQHDVEVVLLKAAVVTGSLDQDGYAEDLDYNAFEHAMLAAIDHLGPVSADAAAERERIARQVENMGSGSEIFAPVFAAIAAQIRTGE